MTEQTHDQGQPAGRPDDQPEGHAARDAQPPSPPPPVEPHEVVVARAEFQREVATRRENALDSAELSTVRQRMIYATELARAGILPRAFRSARPGEDGFRETAANVLLAFDAGSDLGLSPMASLRLINVVEGKPSLGAEGVRACILNAGHDIWTDDDTPVRNGYGIAVSATVHGSRNGSERSYSATFTLDQAAAAGLCAVERDEDGEVRTVRARSQSGKVLPWEAYTGDMLENRATTKLARRAFPDVTGGLSYERDELAPETVAQPGPPPARASRQQASAPTSPAPAADEQQGEPADEVLADLALFSEGDPWWKHAGANVRRRTKQQLAADRLAKAREAGDERVPASPDEPVDAEIVPDAPEAAPTPAEPAEAATAPAPTPSAPEPAADEAQSWPTPAPIPPSAPDAPVVFDGPAEAQAVEQALTEPASANAAEPAAGEPGWAGDPWPGDADYDGSAEDVPPAQEPAALDRAELWAEVEALATGRGKTAQQLMARWTLANRTNPEDASAEQLDAFLEPYREMGSGQ